MKKLLVICGPTATGKTSLGIKLAKRFSGEIVSADSRQMYRGMDIGTGKDLPANPKFEILSSKQIRNSKFEIRNYQIGYYEIDGVKVWLYDVVEPDYRFSVADHVRCAKTVIKDIWKRKKLPILVGGTGFYIKGVIDGVETIGIKPDWELREKLRNYEITRLREKLKKLDSERWERMNESDRKNPRRLVRAIEIALSDKKLTTLRKLKGTENTEKDVLMIGLKAQYKILYQQIDRRVKERVTQGVIKEIEQLLEKGYSWENSALGTTIGYREWQSYFASSVKLQASSFKEQVIQQWKYNEHAYARRQMTWFRKVLRLPLDKLGVAQDKQAHAFWFDISKKGWENRVEKLVTNWYSENNF